MWVDDVLSVAIAAILCTAGLVLLRDAVDDVGFVPLARGAVLLLCTHGVSMMIGDYCW